MAQFNPIQVSNPNILGNIQAGQQIGQQFRLGRQQAAQSEKEVSDQAIRDRFKSVTNAAVTAKNLPDDASRIGFLTKRIGELNERGIDTSDTQEVLDLYNSGQSDQANSLINSAVQTGQQLGIIEAQTGQPKGFTLGAGQQRFDALGNLIASGPERSAVSAKPAGLVQFESLTEGLTDDQKKEATLIQLGLSPRAVGSAIQTIAGAGIEEIIGDASATIKQREKFGELTGSSRAKTIDQGFDKINKINTGIGNIDRAVKLLNSGAGVGAIQRFLPSFKAASVELDNIQKSMALDVIGAVTFGALSQGELNLAKEVALPTGLSKDQLIDHLSRRKAAQEKLRGYYEEQIQFLDQGGTVAGFLRSKDRGSDQQPAQEQAAQQQAQAAPQQPAPTPAPQQADQGVIHVDANGNRAIVFADGSFKELP